jgi:hypothetical protein
MDKSRVGSGEDNGEAVEGTTAGMLALLAKAADGLADNSSCEGKLVRIAIHTEASPTIVILPAMIRLDASC